MSEQTPVPGNPEASSSDQIEQNEQIQQNELSTPPTPPSPDTVTDPTTAAVGDKIDLDAVAASQAAPAAAAITPEEFERRQEEERARREEERKPRVEEQEARDKAFAELEAFKASGTAFSVTIDERVKGGLRGSYNSLRIFLPASHFGLRKNVSEEELQQSVGQTFQVKVHELQADEAGFKSAVVSRRDVLSEETWKGLEVGAVFEGVVSSVTAFGAFVNIGGIEGLVHVSRLSTSRIENPADVVKKGDRLKVTISDIDREKQKLSLSHREHEADAWEGVESTFAVGTKHSGVVKRITDFGAYVQVAPKIEGLLRISELSWTQRVKHPSDVISVGQTIDVQVLDVNPGKHQMSLGYKQTQPNPWLTIAEQLPVGTETTGVVQHVTTQGAVLRINDTFDGFMPRSKMASAGKGKKVDLEVGQTVECFVADVDPGAASLILAMKNEDGTPAGANDRDRDRDRNRDRDRGGYERGGNRPPKQDLPPAPGMTLGDLLNDASKSKLSND